VVFYVVNKILLQATFSLSQADNVLFRTDGRYYPSSGSVAANVHIKVNGNLVSNNSTIDWRGSTSTQQHSFNAIGSVYLPAGTHTVQLLGSVVGGTGSFQVGAGSNLSAFVHPADIVLSAGMLADSAVISLDTSNWSDLLHANPSAITQNYNIPYVGLASVTTTILSDVIALSSGYSYRHASSGDAFFSIFADGTSPGNNYASWAMQDLWEGAEIKAPFYNHARFQSLQSNSNVSLIATEAPWGPPEQTGYDGVSYRVGATTKLIALYGSIQVSGSGTSILNNNTSAPNSFYKPWEWIFVGCYVHISGCPANGTPYLIAQGDMIVPSGHHGNVIFSANSRVQADNSDTPGGYVSLFLELDGKPVGSIGVQGLSGESERTLTASYLATGNNKRAPGPHILKVYIKTHGNFKHLAVEQGVPLIWFD